MGGGRIQEFGDGEEGTPLRGVQFLKGDDPSEVEDFNFRIEHGNFESNFPRESQTPEGGFEIFEVCRMGKG